MRHFLTTAGILAATLAPPSPLTARQAPATVTEADYARAESFLSASTSPLVFGAAVQPNWLSGDRFWYRRTAPGGSEFILVDPAAGTRARAFDHERLAAALSEATGDAVDAANLPFRTFEFGPGEASLTVQAGGARLRCGLEDYRCEEAPPPSPAPAPDAIVSPDGQSLTDSHLIEVIEVTGT